MLYFIKEKVTCVSLSPKDQSLREQVFQSNLPHQNKEEKGRGLQKEKQLGQTFYNLLRFQENYLLKKKALYTLLGFSIARIHSVK